MSVKLNVVHIEETKKSS